MSGWGTIYNQAAIALRMHTNLLAHLQEQAFTGSRVIRPSDDPSDASRILQLKSETQSLQDYSKNLANVESTLGQADGIMTGEGGISDVLKDGVLPLLIKAASETNSAQRVINGKEIDALLEHIIFLANTKTTGRYLFSGAAMTTTPYTTTETDGRITWVEYKGSLNDLPVPVAPGVEYSGVLVGDHIFRSEGPWAPVFLGKSGADHGTGVSNITTDVSLVLTHDQTTFIGGSNGLANGTSTADDTILGEHTLTLDTVASTIQLDGGTAVSYTGAETDLEVTNDDGDKVYLDMTGALGPSGDITVKGSGFLSIDGGLSTTALTDFTDTRVAVRDSQTNRVLYVDATGIQRVGTDLVRVVPNAYDLFGTLINARDVLLNEQGLTPTEQTQLLDEALGSLERAMSGVRRSTTTTGARRDAMESLQISLGNLQFNAHAQATALQQADIAQIAIDIARTQTLYEMTLASTSRLLRLSLLDFI